jgi:fermentation-respiration switch protein FrsA (DUF1100 family)
MDPFIVKPGETIKGLGLNFSARLANGETISSAPTVTADAGLTVSGQAFQGATALADIAVAANQPDGLLTVHYSVTGTLGSVRKGARTISVLANSN